MARAGTKQEGGDANEAEDFVQRQLMNELGTMLKENASRGTAVIVAGDLDLGIQIGYHLPSTSTIKLHVQVPYTGTQFRQARQNICRHGTKREFRQVPHVCT